jgi:hypothetical protein
MYFLRFFVLAIVFSFCHHSLGGDSVPDLGIRPKETIASKRFAQNKTVQNEVSSWLNDADRKKIDEASLKKAYVDRLNSLFDADNQFLVVDQIVGEFIYNFKLPGSSKSSKPNSRYLRIIIKQLLESTDKIVVIRRYSPFKEFLKENHDHAVAASGTSVESHATGFYRLNPIKLFGKNNIVRQYATKGFEFFSRTPLKESRSEEERNREQRCIEFQKALNAHYIRGADIRNVVQRSGPPELTSLAPYVAATTEEIEDERTRKKIKDFLDRHSKNAVLVLDIKTVDKKLSPSPEVGKKLLDMTNRNIHSLIITTTSEEGYSIGNDFLKSFFLGTRMGSIEIRGIHPLEIGDNFLCDPAAYDQSTIFTTHFRSVKGLSDLATAKRIGKRFMYGTNLTNIPLSAFKGVMNNPNSIGSGFLEGYSEAMETGGQSHKTNPLAEEIKKYDGPVNYIRHLNGLPPLPVAGGAVAGAGAPAGR